VFGKWRRPRKGLENNIKMQIIAFRDVILHDLVDGYQCFGGIS
jgi:hypothetical protein